MKTAGRLGTAGLIALIGLVTVGPRPTEPRGLFVVSDDGVPVRLGAEVGGAPPAALLRAVADRLWADFGLPLPARVTAYVYGSSKDFTRGLVTHASLPPARAAGLAEFAIGVALPSAIILRTPPRDISAEWPRLLAHELTHVAQIELAGGEDGPAQWLLEGTAEWVAFRVLDQRRPGAWRTHQVTARAAAEAYVRATGGLDLDKLSSPRGFQTRHRRAGASRTYQLAFDMADDLVRRHGFPALVRYFRAFRDSPAADRNFMRAFDMTTEQFQRSTMERLMVGSADPAFRAPSAASAATPVGHRAWSETSGAGRR